MLHGLVGDSLTKNTSSKITLEPFLKPLWIFHNIFLKKEINLENNDWSILRKIYHFHFSFIVRSLKNSRSFLCNLDLNSIFEFFGYTGHLIWLALVKIWLIRMCYNIPKMHSHCCIKIMNIPIYFLIWSFVFEFKFYLFFLYI